MNNPRLYFSGADFSPIVKNDKNGKKYCFGFYSKINDEVFIPTGNEKRGIKKILFDLFSNKEKQLNILKKFLEEAQNSINDMILMPSSKDEGKLLYDYHNQVLYFGGLVGVVSIKEFDYYGEKYDVTLQINTRMDYGVDDEDNVVNISNRSKAIKPFFLMTLLFDGFVPLGNSVVDNDPEALTDMLLLYSFAENYRKAYVKGYYKTYHVMTRNDDRMKGAVDIARHIRLNAGLNNGKIAYSYKEKGEFNYINHLIVAAYEQLKYKYREQANSAFKASMELHDSLELLKIRTQYPQFSKKTIVAKTSTPMSHPFYTEYEDLRKTCLKVLREEKTSLFNGEEDEKVQGVLMYVPDLWEKYIEKFFKNLTFKSQDQIKIIDVNSDEQYQQNTRPDFVFYKDFKPYMILDAKFKPGWMSVAQSGKIGDLLLPDYDKCVRDMISINANAAGVIFPTNNKIDCSDKSFSSGGKSFEYIHNISHFNSKHKFLTFPIYVPPINKNFVSWRTEFVNNCRDTFDKISSMVSKFAYNTTD